jgi:hypothetical protein
LGCDEWIIGEARALLKAPAVSPCFLLPAAVMCFLTTRAFSGIAKEKRKLLLNSPKLNKSTSLSLCLKYDHTYDHWRF